MCKSYKQAGIYGIVSLIISTVLIFLSAFEVAGKIDLSAVSTGFYLYIALYVIEVIAYIMFIMGFVKIAKHFKSDILLYSAWAFLVSSVVFALYDIYLRFTGNASDYYITIATLILLGITSVFYGIGLIKLKELNGLAMGAGILNVIIGISFASVIYPGIGLLLIYPAQIVEIVLLFKASKMFDGKEPKTVVHAEKAKKSRKAPAKKAKKNKR